jgi:hypothetical protein
MSRRTHRPDAAVRPATRPIAPVDALTVEMQRFFRSRPELRTSPELVDAVLQAVE